MSVNDELIDRILEGETSNEEAAEFQRWLQVPAHLERFALRAELHSGLRRSLQRRNIQASAVAASREDISAMVSPSLDTPVSHLRNVLVWTVAGLVTAAGLLVAFILLDSNRKSDSDSSAAFVVSDVNALLTKDGQPWSEAGIPAGGYELQKGLLNLRFGGRVMVYIEAPARFDAINDRRVVLHSGRLSARVPPEGIGFTVETPEAEVVDFGTEFSIDVEGGASEVHVFDGLVRVHPGASDRRDGSMSVDVRTSQAVRITDGAAKPVDIAIATDRFIRNFDEPKRKYARSIKRLAPLAYYRMPIRDRGLVSEPPEYSGVVLTGEGFRPPHARGVFIGGSLRVGADSTGRGGRVDSPPALRTGQFSLAVYVYLETLSESRMVATNLNGNRGNFGLSLDENGMLHATVRSSHGDVSSAAGDSVLPLKTWRHVVVTVNGELLQLYEDGKRVASVPCRPVATSDADTLWFGTDGSSQQVWNGRIDELALFDRALTEQEIAELYRTAQEEIARSR